MKRLTVAAVLALALAGASTASADPGGKATGGVKYSGGIAGNLNQADFTAQGDGVFAQGRVHKRVVDATTGAVIREFVGVVTCYAQHGNVAYFSGYVTKEMGPEPGAGPFFDWAVQDNGEGQNAAPDLIRTDRNAAPTDCAALTFMPTQPVDEGNIQVH